MGTDVFVGTRVGESVAIAWGVSVDAAGAGLQAGTSRMNRITIVERK
jgi:hypothetical protein